MSARPPGACGAGTASLVNDDKCLTSADPTCCCCPLWCGEDQQKCCLQDCKEFLLWELVVHWARLGSKTSNGTVSAGLQRDITELEQALPLIRFPLMSKADLNTIALHPLARSSRLLSELLAEARAAHADAARAEELQVRPSFTANAVCISSEEPAASDHTFVCHGDLM